MKHRQLAVAGPADALTGIVLLVWPLILVKALFGTGMMTYSATVTLYLESRHSRQLRWAFPAAGNCTPRGADVVVGARVVHQLVRPG